MKNFNENKKFNYSVEDLKRRVFLEAAATAMLANLKLRKQKSQWLTLVTGLLQQPKFTFTMKNCVFIKLELGQNNYLT